jgi:bifunctional ADP-heptose synthase (sugar kinase/adenylyltransferase)
MDSRQKIVSPPEALGRFALWGDYTLVSGAFDPLLASHARRLESVRSAGLPLAVMVTDPASPILPARARAELVAALSAVELVILPDASPVPLPPPSFRFEEQDCRDREAFMAHVRERQA